MTSYLERLRHELEDATGGSSGQALAHGPSGKWSPAQILEHLYLTYKQTNRGVRKCLDQGAPLATRSTLKELFAATLVMGFGYIPGGRQSPERVAPRGMPPDEVQKTMSAELGKMVSTLDECERRFGARARIMDHPFLGPLTAEQWRKFHWVHGRHHARQIRARIGKV
jgi:Protein of unknown function (DUF1569)